MNEYIADALPDDLEQILQLQYLAYQSEAALCGTQDIPPLKPLQMRRKSCRANRIGLAGRKSSTPCSKSALIRTRRSSNSLPVRARTCCGSLQ